MEVYLDNELSPRPPDSVVDFIRPYFNEIAFGSPKVPHKLGLEAFEFIEEVLDLLGRKLNSDGDFTILGSGTEANNLAILGLAREYRRGNIVVSEIEHRSILDTALSLQEMGFEIRMVPVDDKGHVRLEKLEELVDKDTILVGIQLVNQETGSIQDLRAVSDVVRDRGITLHVDACDALGRLPLDLREVDMLSLSGSKIYGPRGTGFLYVKQELDLKPMMSGSSGIQALTPVDINIPALAGFYKAFQLFGEPDVWRDVKAKRDRIAEELLNLGVTLNSPEEAIDVVNFSLGGGAGAFIMEASSRGIYLSQGTSEPVSHVLMAMGRERSLAENSLMIKLHPYITEEEVDFIIEVVSELIKGSRGSCT